MNTRAANPIPSDNTLLDLNACLEAAVSAYLPDDVNICFDLPDPDTPPTVPTISLFLYGIQEDLELRTGIVRQFNSDGSMAPGHVNIKCDYLITYWGQGSALQGEGPSARADSQAMITMNQVLNALINNRELNGMSGSYTRVITPQELGNLSHFWQALGNKPRMCLNYSATVPVQLTAPGEMYVPVAEDKLQADLQQTTPERNAAINDGLLLRD